MRVEGVFPARRRGSVFPARAGMNRDPSQVVAEVRPCGDEPKANGRVPRPCGDEPMTPRPTVVFYRTAAVAVEGVFPARAGMNRWPVPATRGT